MFSSAFRCFQGASAALQMSSTRRTSRWRVRLPPFPGSSPVPSIQPHLFLPGFYMSPGRLVAHGVAGGESCHELCNLLTIPRGHQMSQELELVARFQDIPQIVSIWGACVRPPNMALVYELVEGGSLAQRIHHGPKMTYPEILKVRLAVPSTPPRFPLPLRSICPLPGFLCKSAPSISPVALSVAFASYLSKRHAAASLASRRLCSFPHATACPSQAGFDIALGLSRLHPTVVHRDLKPGNILVGNDGTCKLTDFGLSRGKDPYASYISTEAGGTPNYMPPEMFDGSRFDEKVDIYSLGLVLCECITGSLPWASCNMAQVIFQISIQVGSMHGPSLPACASLFSWRRNLLAPSCCLVM